MSRAILLSLLPLATAAALSSCAPTAGKDGQTGNASARQCFQADQVRNFRGGDDQSIYIRGGRNEVFQLRSAGFCPNLDSALGLTIRSQAGIGSRLCTGDWAEVSIARSSTGPCRVEVGRQLTEAEIEALPGRNRP